jgi:hypothetical protein
VIFCAAERLHLHALVHKKFLIAEQAPNSGLVLYSLASEARIF